MDVDALAIVLRTNSGTTCTNELSVPPAVAMSSGFAAHSRQPSRSSGSDPGGERGVVGDAAHANGPVCRRASLSHAAARVIGAADVPCRQNPGKPIDDAGYVAPVQFVRDWSSPVPDKMPTFSATLIFATAADA
jgi:hypothetical protein